MTLEESDKKLCNDKTKSEIEEKLLCSLFNSIKALAECKNNPKSFKDKPDDEISIIDETHTFKQTEDIANLITDELEDENLIIDEIKQKLLPKSNICRESDNIKIQPEDKNKDGEDCNKQSKEPSTILEIDLDDDTVITNDGRTEPVLEVVTQVKQENDWTNNLKEVLNPLDNMSDPTRTDNEQHFENKIQSLKYEECYFMTTNELRMEIHNESLHKNEAMFACHICDYKSFSRNDIVNHNSQMPPCFGQSPKFYFDFECFPLTSSLLKSLHPQDESCYRSVCATPKYWQEQGAIARAVW